MKKYAFLFLCLLSGSSAVSGATISGMYVKYNDLELYNYKIQVEDCNYERLSLSYQSKSLQCEGSATEFLYYVLLQESTKSLNKLEKTYSIGYQVIDNCAIFAGVREDVVGRANLARIQCGIKFSSLSSSYTYLYTELHKITTFSLKYNFGEMFFVGCELSDDDVKEQAFDRERKTCEVGITF